MFFVLDSAQQLRPTKWMFWASCSLLLPLLYLAVHQGWPELRLQLLYGLVLLHSVLASLVLTVATHQYLNTSVRRLPFHLRQPLRMLALIVCLVTLVFTCSCLVYHVLPAQAKPVQPEAVSKMMEGTTTI
jgi:hypothetical protein